MDFEKARYNMVEQQVRPWEVLNDRVLDAMSCIPREQFAPQQYKSLAYADTRIPLGDYEGQSCCMLNPNIVGRILQALNIGDEDVVLEIGTGSGYLTACIAKLARHVDSVEICEQFIEPAEEKLNALNVHNFCITEGDASKGWDQQKPSYDCIAITGAMAEVPECYKNMLKVGGRLFVVIGEEPAMKACLVTRLSKKEWLTQELFETCIDPLCKTDAPKEKFVF